MWEERDLNFYIHLSWLKNIPFLKKKIFFEAKYIIVLILFEAKNIYMGINIFNICCHIIKFSSIFILLSAKSFLAFKGAIEMLEGQLCGEECSLYKREDLSLDPKIHIHSLTWLLYRLVALVEYLQVQKRLCLKGVMWKMIAQNFWYPPLVSIAICIYTHTLYSHTCEYTQKCKWWLK